jgi:hypothetical protein
MLRIVVKVCELHSGATLSIFREARKQQKTGNPFNHAQDQESLEFQEKSDN